MTHNKNLIAINSFNTSVVIGIFISFAIIILVVVVGDEVEISIGLRYGHKLELFDKVIYTFKDFIDLHFRHRAREGEREGKKHQCVVASCMAKVTQYLR